MLAEYMSFEPLIYLFKLVIYSTFFLDKKFPNKFFYELICIQNVHSYAISICQVCFSVSYKIYIDVLLNPTGLNTKKDFRCGIGLLWVFRKFKLNSVLTFDGTKRAKDVYIVCWSELKPILWGRLKRSGRFCTMFS